MDIQETAARTPWLSVIIPIYHAEKYLQQCLDSIRSQTESDFEVLMVDDGSQDSSGEICCRYAAQDRRFRYFKKENGGAYQTRIYGAEQSCGTYVTFCDADDYYTTPDAFKLLRQYLSDGNYAAAQFGYEKKFRHLKQKKPCVQAPVPVDREGFLAREYPMVLCSYWDDATLTTNVWNKVYHRKLLSNFPSSREAERIFWGDDLIMNLHLLSTCDSFLFIPDNVMATGSFPAAPANSLPERWRTWITLKNTSCTIWIDMKVPIGKKSGTPCLRSPLPGFTARSGCP